MRKLVIVVAILVAVAALPAAVAWAANTSSSLDMTPKRVHLSVDAVDAVVDELDSGTSASKRAAVVAFKSHERDVVILVRIQDAPNGLFVDIVGDRTIGEVTTRTSAMNLSARSHPSPTVDAIDAAILAAAALD